MCVISKLTLELMEVIICTFYVFEISKNKEEGGKLLRCVCEEGRMGPHRSFAYLRYQFDISPLRRAMNLESSL